MTGDRGLPRWTDEEVLALIAEARSEAREQVKETLREAYARSLARRVESLAAGPTRAGAAAEIDRPPPGARRGAAAETAETAETETAQEPRPAADAPLWYVYGVVAAADLPGDLAGSAGPEPVQDGGAVTGIEHAGLAAVASPVPRERYAAEPLMRGLNDRAWLERVALAHERVLRALLPRAVVPFRLCSVFSEPCRVVALMEERDQALRETLRRVRGRTELGVKVMIDPAALRRAAAGKAPPEQAAEQAADGEGSAYLARRRHRRQLEEHAHELAGKVSSAVHDRLSGFAVAAVRGRPQPRELTADSRWMVLNGAYLVDTAATDAFAREVGRLGRRFGPAGVELALTGPWVPYNFTRIGGETDLEAVR